VEQDKAEQLLKKLQDQVQELTKRVAKLEKQLEKT